MGGCEGNLTKNLLIAFFVIFGGFLNFSSMCSINSCYSDGDTKTRKMVKVIKNVQKKHDVVFFCSKFSALVTI